MGRPLTLREERQLVLPRLADPEEIPVHGGFALLFGLALSLQAFHSLMLLYALGA